MTKFRYPLSRADRELVTQLKALEKARTPGTWSATEDGRLLIQGEEIACPEDDPDRKYLEFLTAHAADLVRIIETHYA